MRVLEANHNALAVPVIVNGEVFATASARFYTTAMTLQQVVERYSEDMINAADRMGTGISSWRASLPGAVSH